MTNKQAFAVREVMLRLMGAMYELEILLPGVPEQTLLDLAKVVSLGETPAPASKEDPETSEDPEEDPDRYVPPKPKAKPKAKKAPPKTASRKAPHKATAKTFVSFKARIVSVMGDKSMRAADVYEAMKAKGVPFSASANIKTYIGTTLASNKATFEVVPGKKGLYRVKARHARSESAPPPEDEVKKEPQKQIIAQKTVN